MERAKQREQVYFEHTRQKQASATLLKKEFARTTIRVLVSLDVATGVCFGCTYSTRGPRWCTIFGEFPFGFVLFWFCLPTFTFLRRIHGTSHATVECLREHVKVAQRPVDTILFRTVHASRDFVADLQSWIGTTPFLFGEERRMNTRLWFEANVHLSKGQEEESIRREFRQVL